MKKLLFIVPLGLLFACGDSTPAETPVVLNTAEDKIGYVLGALNAESIMQSGDKMKDLDKDELIAGFNENLNKKDCSECDEELKKLDFEYIKNNFSYSILDVYKSTIEDKRIINREYWWMNTLQSREFGYNYLKKITPNTDNR